MLKQKTQAELIEELNFGTPYVASKAENELKRRGLLDSDIQFQRAPDPLSNLVKGIFGPSSPPANLEQLRQQAMASAVTPPRFEPETSVSMIPSPAPAQPAMNSQPQELLQGTQVVSPAQSQFSVFPQAGFNPASRPEMTRDMMSGLLGGAKDIGGGILGAIRGAINPSEIMQAYELAEQARMQQPALVTASQLANLRPITAAGVVSQVPQEMARREAVKLKAEVDKQKLSQVKAIKAYREEASKAKPDIAKLQELLRAAYPELVAKQQFAKVKPETKSQIQARVMSKALQSGVASLSPEEKQVYDSSLKAPDFMSQYFSAPEPSSSDTITLPENFESLSDAEQLKIIEG